MNVDNVQIYVNFGQNKLGLITRLLIIRVQNMYTLPFSAISASLDTKKTTELATETSIAHHIKGIRPALSVMETLGFSAIECLQGSGITLETLERSDQGISLQQELAFYRRLLALTQDPQLGLKLGKAYRLENYGMLGYAILSAQTLGEALKIAKEFGPLNFSHFELDFALIDGNACIIMRHNKKLESELMALYEDRDCAAIIYGSMSALGRSFPIQSIDLMRPKPANTLGYEQTFQCPIRFAQKQMCIRFATNVLTTPMPLRDAETSNYCRQQCQQLLEKISHQESFSGQVKSIITQKDSHFPSLKTLGEILGMPERTIRRKLAEEGYKFQNMLNDARFEQAKILLQNGINLTQIAQNLGYSEVGNFSHAFKRWCGVSPTQFREQLTAIKNTKAP